MAVWIGLGIGFVIAVIIFCVQNNIHFTSAGRAAWRAQQAQLVCPHCQVQGGVQVSSAIRKRGISGAKATGAVMTGGLSMLATGLSRKERVNALHCRNCGITWDA